MARVLIFEPFLQIAELVSEIVRNAGHEPLLQRAAAEPPAADLLVVEPAAEGALDFVRAARKRQPELPVICVSVYPAVPELAWIEPSGHIVKPFPIARLEAAVERALVGRPAP